MNKTKKKKGRVILFIVIFVIAFSVWLWWENTSIQTTHVNIRSEKIPTELDGFTIVQVSDLHNAEFGNQQDRLLKAVKSASPDIIAVTGDLIDSNHSDVTKAMEFINGAVKIAPVYYVTGNHEAWSDQYIELKKQMLMVGVDVLEDENIIIEYAGVTIQLLGLNDLDFITTDGTYERLAMIDTKLKNILGESNKYTILLSHRPELFDVYVENNIDLVLSGHAHGGQVRLPFFRGLVAPNQGFFPKYFEGLYDKKQTKMIVSRGLGNSIIPLRVNNRPELVIVELMT
jgi:predicted MPP superfamily phosphohydrolase